MLARCSLKTLSKEKRSRREKEKAASGAARQRIASSSSSSYIKANSNSNQNMARRTRRRQRQNGNSLWACGTFCLSRASAFFTFDTHTRKRKERKEEENALPVPSLHALPGYHLPRRLLIKAGKRRVAAWQAPPHLSHPHTPATSQARAAWREPSPASTFPHLFPLRHEHGRHGQAGLVCLPIAYLPHCRHTARNGTLHLLTCLYNKKRAAPHLLPSWLLCLWTGTVPGGLVPRPLPSIPPRQRDLPVCKAMT